MHAPQAQPHYTPTSVGGLMDPAFLRGAVIDANGGQAEAGTSWRTVLLRLRAAMRRFAAVLRRH
jgi:hypothetical protein